MTRFLFAIAFVLLPHVLWAQPLHGHPQLATFGPSYTLKALEAQCHWAPGNNPILSDPQTVVFDLVQGTLGNNTLAHTHFKLDMQQCPIYSEVTGPITCNFAVVLHNTTGRAYLVNEYQGGIRDIVWDATGTGVSPPMIGNPTGDVTFTGHLTIDPAIEWNQHTVHGWFSPQPHVETFYDNGDAQSIKLFASYYSMLDPSAPETYGSPWAGAHCSPSSARHPNDIWGDNLVDVPGMYLPVAPIDQPYPILVGTAGYGGQLLGADLQVRADLDLHHQNGGLLLFDMRGDGDLNSWVSLTPNSLGVGDHKIALMRNQLSSEGNDAVNTLLVFNVTVGPSVPPPPPPPTCTAGFHLDGGVCVADVPPPPPSETFAPATVEMSNLGRVKVCLSGFCVFVPILP